MSDIVKFTCSAWSNKYAKYRTHLLAVLVCYVKCRLQDAEAYNQRNINEEGGGGYIAFVWDCAYWGTQVKLAQFTGSTTYASEVDALFFSAVCLPQLSALRTLLDPMVI